MFLFRFFGRGDEIRVTEKRVKGQPFPVAWPGDRPHTRMAYRQYLASAEWDFRSGMFVERAMGQCQQCGEHRNLHVHHKHYRTLGEERYEDVEVLCEKHHKSRHRGWK